MCVCVCVCVCGVHSCVCGVCLWFVYVFACLCVCLHMCLFVCMFVCMYVCPYVCASLSTVGGEAPAGAERHQPECQGGGAEDEAQQLLPCCQLSSGASRVSQDLVWACSVEPTCKYLMILIQIMIFPVYIMSVSYLNC